MLSFNKNQAKRQKKAEQEKILISSFNIIYEVLDFIKGDDYCSDVQEKIGSAEILESKVSKLVKLQDLKLLKER